MNRIQIDLVYSWEGRSLPERYQNIAYPIYVTGDEFLQLADDYDVAIMHSPQLQPSRKERGRGAKPVPDKIILCLDAKGKKFSQR